MKRNVGIRKEKQRKKKKSSKTPDPELSEM